MSTDPMRVWDLCPTTDKRFTKKVSYGSHAFTTIDAQWQLEVATRQWGPYGKAWGIRDMRFSEIVTEDVLDNGTPIKRYTLALDCEFFYPDSGDTVSFPVSVDMPFKHGGDLRKKLATSARSKALSYLGFSADVYMGKFDDPEYLRDVEMRYQERSVVFDTIHTAILKADDVRTLRAMEAKLSQMVKEKTLTADMASDLLREVESRVASLPLT